ncbi:MAG TPA: hypothetical protein EYF95_03550 [Flavobacteriales bacterium]|jgi:hypothetical protein|nr:hypothetical protein [Flavobacteriales bacterium]
MRASIKIGNVVRLKDKYSSTAKYAIVIDIRKSEFPGDDGWITFDYLVMNESGILVNISGCCIEEIIK